jgi:SAM-dependent methyltransferase
VTHPVRLYDDGLLRASEHGSTPVLLRVRDGTSLPLPLDRYLGPPDVTDLSVLARVRGPVLDVGCGPGRHLHALIARGVFALGVDLSPTAVELATGRGARAVEGSVFGDLPGAGSWRTALLLDGNIGIGGGPTRLLARIRALLREDGELLLELGGPREPTETMLVRIETEHEASSWFSWARVSVTDVTGIAGAAGFEVHGPWTVGGRWFASLSPRSRTSCARAG